MRFPLWLRALLLSPSVVAIAAATRLLLMANLDPVVAAKLATTGGVLGTLTGTIIPLLPPLLPLLVVWLVIARRPFLASLAALSTALVSPAKVTWKEAAGWVIDSFPRLFYPAEWSTYFARTSVLEIIDSHLWIISATLLSFMAAFAAVPKWLSKGTREDREKKIENDLESYEENLIPVRINRELIDPPNKFDDDYKTSKDHEGRPIPSEKPGQAMRSPDRLKFEHDRQLWRRAARAALKQRRKNSAIRRMMLYRPLWATGWAVIFALPALTVIAHTYPVPIGLDPSFQLRRPWTPPEVITTQSGFREVGYVLSNEDKWAIILTENDRTIDYLRSEDIAERSVCSTERAATPDAGPLIHLPGVNKSTSPPCQT